jgi:hypothetical protein
MDWAIQKRWARKTDYPVSKGWQWNALREHAAQLVADGELSSAQIGKRIHVSDRTVDTWRQVPDFRARVEEHLLTRYRERFLLDLAHRSSVMTSSARLLAPPYID